jgi:hypothetical protein
MRVYTRSQRFLGLADANNALLVPRRLIATQQTASLSKAPDLA